MARKPRLYVPGALYHVMPRGNDGQRIFVDDEDRGKFLAFVGEGVGRFGRDLSSISRNVAVVRRLIEEDRAFKQRYMKVKRYATSQA